VRNKTGAVHSFMFTLQNNGSHFEHHQPAAESQNGAAHAHLTPGIAAFWHADIAALAYERRQRRGCPNGSSQEDWFRAAEELRSRTYSR